MGFFKVASRFFFLLYSQLIFVFLFINLLSFAGFNVVGDGYFHYLTNSNTFENSYFGFSSLLSAFEDFPDFNLFEDLGNFFYKFYRSLSESVKSFEAFKYSDFWVDTILKGTKVLVDITLLPFNLLFATLGAFLTLASDLLQLFEWLAKLFCGYYNTPIVATTPVVNT